MSVYGSKLGLSKVFVGGTLFGLEGGDKGVTGSYQVATLRMLVMVTLRV